MGLFHKDELKLLWPFYLDSLISPMLYFLPIFIFPYLYNIGVSALYASILFASMFLSTIIFEIPTGAFADAYGRKLSVLLGYFLSGILIALVPLTTNFWILLALFVLLGAASTFASGAKEAWIVDLVKKCNKDMIRSYFTKAQFFDSFGVIASGFLGAAIVKTWGISYAWYIGGLSYSLAALLLAFAKENFKRLSTSVRQSYQKIKLNILQSINFSRTHHVIFYFLIASMFLLIAGGLQSGLVWTSMLKSLGIQDYVFGYIWSAAGITGALAAILSVKLAKKNAELRFVVTCIFLETISLMLVLFFNSIASIVIIMLMANLFFMLGQPSKRVYFHRFLPSRLRASIGSVESTAYSIAGVIGMILGGMLLDATSPRVTILLALVINALSLFFYSRISEQK